MQKTKVTPNLELMIFISLATAPRRDAVADTLGLIHISGQFHKTFKNENPIKKLNEIYSQINN